MANIANFEIDGVSYSYDKESRNPLALKNIKKAIEGDLVYDKDSRGITEVVGSNCSPAAPVENQDFEEPAEDEETEEIPSADDAE